MNNFGFLNVSTFISYQVRFNIICRAFSMIYCGRIVKKQLMMIRYVISNFGPCTTDSRRLCSDYLRFPQDIL